MKTGKRQIGEKQNCMADVSEQEKDLTRNPTIEYGIMKMS